MSKVNERNSNLVLAFSEIGFDDKAEVGGKNSSLGHLYNVLRPQGISALDGFCTTAFAYQSFLNQGDLRKKLTKVLSGIKQDDVKTLEKAGEEARKAVLATPFSLELQAAILKAHSALRNRLGRDAALAVRSSATAEDLPSASFAGQHESFLNVIGDEDLLKAVHKCFASLFTDRAIDYRTRQGFDQLSVSISVGIQPMVRSDLASAGVAFTLDPETGFRNVVTVTGSYGLGEMIVQGTIDPDEWVVFKPTLAAAENAIVGRRRGRKDRKLVFSDLGDTHQERVALADQANFCLNDSEALLIAKAGVLIEESYSKMAGKPTPMDIEWAKDGQTGEIYIIQARPETVHSAEKTNEFEHFLIKAGNREPLITGQAVGTKVAAGIVRVVKEPEDLAKVKEGDILVARTTNPDWEPIMKRAAALITDEGGRTAHAAIVSRELGLPCVVGTRHATHVLTDGQIVTVSCAEGAVGRVYGDKVPFTRQVLRTEELPTTNTHVMLNVGDPGKAFGASSYPNGGVGLARIEFVIVSAVGIHPMALVKYPNLADDKAKSKIERRIGSEDPKQFFVQRLSEGVGKIAAAFYPKPVIVRTSDFKTNEYARLIGGGEFELDEENPMLGFRGASRYYNPRYAEGFALECQALKRVRDVMGLTNVKVMIPFCRTLSEGNAVLAEMAKHNLRQGENGLEVYVMCEIPSNAILATEFLSIFDGFSIGSNDLTQLTLGIDRDSGELGPLFDERNPAVKDLISKAIAAGKKLRKHVGICGQAPSDYPDFAAWLVRQGISSISVNPDAVVQTLTAVHEAEQGRLIPGSINGNKTYAEVSKK